MRIAALVTAAGTGTRFGGLKQFAELSPGIRLVDRAVVTARSVADWVGVVVPQGHQWEGEAVDATCIGGTTRRQSIAAGLAAVPETIEIVLIHSASHPLATVAMARRALAAVEAGADGAVPILGLVDVVKRVGPNGSLTTVGREGLGLAQSPMAFARLVLDDAFSRAGDAVEESQLVEAMGGRVVAVGGDTGNIHVVDEAGLTLARAIAATAPVV